MSATNRANIKSSLSFATTGDLSDFATSALEAGDIAFVNNNNAQRHYAFMPGCTAALSGVAIIDAAGNSGRWVQLTIANG